MLADLLRSTGSAALPRLHDWVAPKFTVHVNAAGEVQQVVPHPVPARGERPYVLLGPRLPKARTQTVLPVLLIDLSRYVLGTANTAEAARARSAHAAYLALLRECVAATGNEDVRAVVHFLESARGLGVNTAPDDLIAWSVDWRSPNDHPDVQAFWVEWCSRTLLNETIGTCAVTGERGAMARHAPVVKGVPGGQVSGTHLFSLNGTAFEAYGLPHLGVSQRTAEALSAALTGLLAGEQHTYRPTDRMAYVYWSDLPAAINPLALLDAPSLEHLTLAFQGVQEGARHDPPTHGVRILGVKGNGARIHLHPPPRVTPDELSAHLEAFFDAQSITGPKGEPPTSHGVPVLLGSVLLPQDSSALRQSLTDALVQCAVTGRTLPRSLLARSVTRSRTAGGTSAPLAALLRLLLTQRGIPVPAHFNGGNELRDAYRLAYRCGQYLAVADLLHRSVAQPRVTLARRMYTALARHPARTLPRVSARVQVDLGVLVRRQPRQVGWLKKSLRAVTPELDALPAAFTLEEQGVFALGLYHHQAYLRVRAARCLRGVT